MESHAMGIAHRGTPSAKASLVGQHVRRGRGALELGRERSDAGVTVDVEAHGLPVLLGVDAAGRAEAWVATRPGCVAFGESREAALRAIAEAAWEYDVLLDRAGLTGLWEPLLRPQAAPKPAGARSMSPARAEQTGVRIVEHVPVPEDLVHGNTAAFFQWDAQPASEREVAAALRLLSHTRTLLLKTVHGIDRERWSERPGGGRRTVEEVLRHVAGVEWWYVSRIVTFPMPESGYPDDVEAFMSWTRRRVAGRLQTLTAPERARIAVPDPESGERWSARKVLRRLIYHELYHTYQLRRWLQS